MGTRIVVTGLVQGVGFRPTVYRLARDLGLSGTVRNEGDTVRIEVWGERRLELVDRLKREAPRAARIDGVETTPIPGRPPERFAIVASTSGVARRAVVPDAAPCAACRREMLDPASRRHGYPFTNCTQCGPRFSIVTGIPYDRPNTTMASFEMCPACEAEYHDPEDRRFHAQPNACPSCGPTVALEPGSDGTDLGASFASLVASGVIVAIKGVGGYLLACDATSEDAVDRLRDRKRRPDKPLALMARDAQVAARHATLSEAAREVLESPQAPIVLLPSDQAAEPVAVAVAPGCREVGFMLPSTPLHAVLLARIDRPVVMTSGNHGGAPPATDDADARVRLGGIADRFVVHDRVIANRVDDSVVRFIAGEPRPLRRARGYAPAPLTVPDGFADAPPILAMGGDLKNTFCLMMDGAAVVSQHIGDLGDAATHRDYRRNLDLYRRLYRHEPTVVAVDRHPDYASRHLGLAVAAERGIAVESVQHHHAHLAACMFENGLPRDAPPVLGVALDGLGFGDDGSLWGGELLIVRYDRFERLATFRPIPLLGGDEAMREPWRNAFAHLVTVFGWSGLQRRHGNLPIVRWLVGRPVRTLLDLLQRPVLSPPASSAGRLFDAVAATVGLCRERISYEGQAAMALEAAAEGSGRGYPFAFRAERPLPWLDPTPMWAQLLEDLQDGVPAGVVSGRFHAGLADAVVAAIVELDAARGPFSAIALSGGVFQNRILTERIVGALRSEGRRVLLARELPVNDGGLSLGQAAVAAARRLALRSAGSR